MRSEHTRQTRWGHDPEAMDEQEQPPGSSHVKQLIWAPCNRCDLQVHATLTRFLTHGLTCPECGDRIATPATRRNPEPELAKVRGEEDDFRRQLEMQEIPCSD